MSNKKSDIKRIVKYRLPKPSKAVKTETKPLDRTTRQFLYGKVKGSQVGTLPDDLTFFQSLRLRLGQNELTQPYAQHSWVYGCINAIAQNIARVSFKLAKGEVKSPKIIEEGKIYDLFLNPNPSISRSQLWEATMIYLGLDGECMWLLEKPKGSEEKYEVLPTEIWPVSGRKFKPIVKNNMIIGWEYREDNKLEPINLTLAQVIQFKYFNPYNYYRGLSPLSAAKMGIDQDWNAMRWNSAFFENSADPGGILVYKGTQGLTEEQRTAIRQSWEDRHKGPGKARRIAMLEGGIEYQQTQLSHTDMLFLEQRKWNRDEIMAVFKVPKSELSVYEDLNFATALSQDKGFWQKNLIPKMNYLMDVVEGKFFKFIEGGQIWGYFDTSIIEALQEDFKVKLESAKILFDMHYPLNKINKRLELNLEDVPWGNESFIPFALVPASSLVGGSEEQSPRTPPAQETVRRQSTLKIDRKKYWDSYVEKILDPNEKKFQSKIKRYVYELRVNQLKRLEGGKDIIKVEASDIDQILFAQEEWNKRLKEITRPLYETIMTMAGQQLAEETGGLFLFNLTDPKMIEFLNKKLIKVVGINDTVRSNLRETLMEGINAKETINELQDRIKTVFNFTSNRSLTIARTETAQTSSGTRFLAMRMEGMEYHEWLSARDEFVRQPPASPYNHAIDGEVIMVGNKFSNGLKYPSDIEGEPGNVINCRCIALPSKAP